MHEKNIRNMKFNNQIFKIHKKKKNEKFEEFISKLICKETLSLGLQWGVKLDKLKTSFAIVYTSN